MTAHPAPLYPLHGKLRSRANITWKGYLINWALYPFYLLGIGKFRKLDIEEIMKTASRDTGLSDFGDRWFVGVFKRIFSTVQYLPLSPLGHSIAYDLTLRQMTCKLRIQNALERDPSVLEKPIRRPLFITGLPRTGTTYLHRLLALDPECRAPQMWEMMDPLPFVEKATYENDPRRIVGDKEMQEVISLIPHIVGVHELDANKYEECIFAMGLDLSVTPPTFPCMGIDPFFRDGDFTPAYRNYYKFLQILQHKYPPTDHWTLKAPLHLGWLDSLLAVFTDACIVWTHRDPIKAVGSTCSMMATFDDLCMNYVDKDIIGNGTLDYWTNAAQKGHDVLTSLPDNRKYHVMYDDTVKRPIETIQALYQRLGYQYTPEYDAILRDFIAKDQKNRSNQRSNLHTYTTEEFGLSSQQIQDRFTWYYDAYKVPIEKSHTR